MSLPIPNPAKSCGSKKGKNDILQILASSFCRVARNNARMTKTKIEHPDLLEIAAMRARWKEERAAGATGETFARWRVRIKAEVLDELRKVLVDDRRR